ncbi:CIC11C00000005845 [Sungouiella intermedia]|uniref:CIC11C00000005845 n=1 Tax=Sungouiella intermedia TaxID=45354 RepID=A0A1L0D683_9ASCO|nr:CIC11C00000005845 [[Candida] intermedia]
MSSLEPKDSLAKNSNEEFSPVGHHELSVEDFIHDKRPWYKVPHLRKMTFVIFLLTLSSTTSGYDGSVMNGLQSLLHWQSEMGTPTGDRLGHLANGVNFGCIIGVTIAPYICDHYGRRTLVFIGSTVAVIGAILQGCSNSYGFFLASRVVLGFGAVLSSVAAPVLISESAYPLHREASTFAYNVCWYLGAIIASWVTYGTRNINSNYAWKIPSFLQGVLPLVQVVFIFLIPESPRYLVKKGKVLEAEAVLRKFHAGGSTLPEDDALVQFELSEIESAIAAESEAAQSSYLDFIRVPRFRKRLFLVVFVAIMAQLSGNGLVSYYFVQVLRSIGITSTKRQLEINGCLMIYNFVICLTLTNLVTKFKRRVMFLTGCGGMLVCYVIWTILSALNEQAHFNNKSLANGVLAFIFLYYLFYDIGLNGLPFLYLTEVLPYSHRAKGINLMIFVTYSVLIFNGYVNTIAMDAIGWKYYIVYCCVNAVELVIVYFTFPETSGFTLEEVGQVFGDEVPDIKNKTLDNKALTEHVEDV